MSMKNMSGIMQVREKVEIEGMDNRNILDVEVNPMIEKENKFSNKIMYEGSLELTFILSGNDLQVDTRVVKVPFEYTVDGVEDGENTNTKMNIEIKKQFR